MPVLRDIPIQDLIVPQGEPYGVLNLPSTNMPGNWNSVGITLTNNYVDEKYPLTKEDIILIMELTLTKGSTPLEGARISFLGGQFLKFGTIPVPRYLAVSRPPGAEQGTVKISAVLMYYTDLSIGANIEYI